MTGKAPISGTAMAVLLGAASILSAIFVPGINVGDKLILFFFGLLFFLAGLMFSS